MSSEISHLVELSMKHLYNWFLTESGKPLKLVLGGMGIVELSISSHEQTQ